MEGSRLTLSDSPKSTLFQTETSDSQTEPSRLTYFLFSRGTKKAALALLSLETQEKQNSLSGKANSRVYFFSGQVGQAAFRFSLQAYEALMGLRDLPWATGLLSVNPTKAKQDHPFSQSCFFQFV